ncbi:HEAT repeat domain-containing protein [Phycisphaerales bacterium AB-hyl4]|uniref:HEAT repeat domain-containing protein n=1 Tax=Natronomicrosphaera hydrolytica TaxID=3242702 RepID=A0ABV4U261_9BACT
MDALYHHLRGIADPSVDRAMAAALATADQAAIRRMVPMLVERAQPEGMLGLVMQYHRLPVDIQAQVVEQVPRLFRPLREAASRRQGHGPENVITLVQRSRNTRLAYLVSEQLRHGAEGLLASAGSCLLRLAELAASDPKPERLPTLDAEAAAYLQTAITDAVKRFPRHRESSVLLAMAWLLPRPMDEACQAVVDIKSPAGAAMSTLLRRAEHPAARRALLPMLGFASQADAAMDGLRCCNDAGMMSDVLVHYHLLLLPGVRRPLARVKNIESLWPDASRQREFDTSALRGLPTWLDALPADEKQRLASLAGLCNAPDAATRLAVLRRLLTMARQYRDDAELAQSMTQRFVAFCDDPEPALARIAIRHLIATGYPELPRLLTRLVNSPHESVRKLAGVHLSPLGFARLWALWPKLEPARRTAAAQALMKIDANFHRMIGEKLKREDRAMRLRALSMIEQLNQGSFFEAALKRLATDKDEHIASAAVRALGTTESEVSVESVEQALDHPDSRVRANAIEALEQMEQVDDEKQLDRLMTMAEDEANRPRANAIRALMQSRTREALQALTRMLNDDRAEHRVSALWLIKDMGLLSVARKVAEMSLHDPEEQIRQRADTVIRDLIERLTTQQGADGKSDAGEAGTKGKASA